MSRTFIGLGAGFAAGVALALIIATAVGAEGWGGFLLGFFVPVIPTVVGGYIGRLATFR